MYREEKIYVNRKDAGHRHIDKKCPVIARKDPVSRECHTHTFFSNTVSLAIALFIFITLASGALAVQNLMALQGTATNNGTSINNGNLSVTVWTQPTGGALVYNSSNDYNGAINNGRFDVTLGDGSSQLSLQYGQIYYIAISINGQSLSFNGSQRKAFQSSVGSINGTFIVSQELLNVNSSLYAQYLNGYSASIFLGNDTILSSRIDALNTSKAGAGNCPVGQYVQNTTANGVQCAPANNSAGNPFNQNLNTNDNVQFRNITAANITASNVFGVVAWSFLSGIPSYVRDYSSDIAAKLNITDQRYNDTALIVNTLANYYLKIQVYNKSEVYNKTETYTKTEINSLITSVNQTTYINITNNVTAYINTTNNITTYVNTTNNITAYINITNNLTAYTNITSNITTYINITNNITAYVNTTSNITTYINTTNNITTYINTTNNVTTNITNNFTVSNSTILQVSSVYNDTAAIVGKLDVSDQRYNDTNAIAAKLNIADQRFNDTALISTKLDVSDQRYNDTALVNTKLNATDQRYNDTAAIVGKLDASDQRYNETSRISSVNTSGNIKSFGFNLTSELSALFYAASNPSSFISSSVSVLSNFYNKSDSDARYLQLSDQRFNDTALISTKLDVSDQRYNDTALVNTKLNATDQRYNDTSAISVKLDASDQRYNDTALVNTKLSITDQRYNDTALISTKLDASDQRYNDTALANQKASPGDCAAGQVVQNTTTNGVECVSVGSDTIPAGSIDQGVFGSSSGQDASYTFTHNLTVNENIHVSDYVIFDYNADPATPPAGQGVLYVKSVSGRGLTKFEGPSGVNYPLQPSLFQNNIGIISAGSGNTINTFGTGLTSVGTVTHAVSERYGYMANQVTGTTAGNTAGTGDNAVRWYRGSMAGSNGFFFNARLAYPDATYTALRAFVGLTNYTMAASVGSDNPAGNYAGFQYSTARADKNWTFMTKDNSVQSVVDTKMPFNATMVYDFFIYCTPQCTTIYWRVDNLITGASNEGNTSSNLPVGSVALRAGHQISNVDATARTVRMQRIYVESDR